MPIRNEAAHLRAAVAAVLAQEYPRAFRICLAVAPSDDGTESIAADLVDEIGTERLRVVPNPAGVTPAGLNAAIAALDPAESAVLVRVDGHARLSPGYIRRAVETMERTGAVNVGGIQQAVGQTAFERAVAVAMTSRFGTGGARFHIGGEEGPVDTVYLGVFRRSALEAVGGFDEGLVRNQDYELNIRLRAAGGTVWFDPALAVEYRPRRTLGALARQYVDYGWWKAEVARRYPASLKARQIAPAVVTALVALDLVVGVRRWRPLVVGYAIAVVVASIAAAVSATRPATIPIETDPSNDPSNETSTAPSTEPPNEPPVSLAARLMAIYPVMHLGWGAGFISGIVTGLARRLSGRR